MAVSLAKQVIQLLNGASMDDLQDMLEDSMEKLRAFLPALKEQRAKVEDGTVEALKQDEAIKGLEATLAKFDRARAEAIEEAKRDAT